MKKAYVTAPKMGGKKLATVLIDLNNPANLPYYQSALKKGESLSETHVCKDCGKHVKLVGKESANGKGPQLEFEHADPKSEKLCPASFAASVHWDPVYSHNNFDAREKGRNKAMWEQWKSRNRGELNGIIHTLEGRNASENRKALIAERFRDSEAMIMPMIGLNPRIALAVIAVGIGRVHTQWPGGREIPVQFKWAGQSQTFIAKDRDGKEHKQFVPGNKVVLCIDGNSNRLFFPKRGNTPIYIQVFPETASDPRASMAKGQSTFPNCAPG